MKEEEHRFYFSKKMKIVLFSLLILLNFILRIPFYPHEYGADSFVIHILGDSVSEFGCAKWWVNPLSVVGLYPYSECSAVPFILSGLSQCTGIDIEKVILLFCIFLGLFTVFAAYILAGAIWDNDAFKFLVAFGLSTCPAILNYLTWTITMRAPFIALLPLFVYSLFKCRDYKLRFAFLVIILFVLLFATHHLAYFLIPVFIGYLIAVMFYTLKNLSFCGVPPHDPASPVRAYKKALPKKDYIYNKIPRETITSVVLIIGFLIMFMIPFQTGHFIVGSRYSAAPDLFFGNLPRYVGFLLIFAFGGFTYLLFKHDKSFEEWSLLLIFMFLTPFLYVQTYMKWFIPCFIFLFVGVGLINTLKVGKQKRKCAIVIIIIFLLLSVSFSSFYQHWRTKGGGVHLFDSYMKEPTYTAGLWIKENINNGSLIANVQYIRLFAVSGVPLFTGSGTVDQAYGFANVSELELKKKSITEESYWFNGPYEITSWTSESYYKEVLLGSYENYKLRYSKFNFTHIIEDKRIPHGYFAYHGIRPSKFLDYIYDRNGCIYDNGEVCVWNL